MLRKLLALSIMIIVLAHCRNFPKENYCIKEFKRHTGLRHHFKIEQSNITDSQFVLNVKIDDSACAKLQKQFFFNSYKNYLEEITNPKREPNSNYKMNGFNLADDNYTYYLGSIPSSKGYFVICLSKEKNHLIFAESN